MATQPVVELGGTPFLDRMPRKSREQVLVNSTRIRYPAGTIAFQPGDPDRADTVRLELVCKPFTFVHLSHSLVGFRDKH